MHLHNLFVSALFICVLNHHKKDSLLIYIKNRSINYGIFSTLIFLLQTRKWYWSPEFRNPCWNDYKFHCAPYFFVTGFPKCGTTDLYERMTYHPGFRPPLFKEIHWITRYRFLSHRHEKNPSQTVRKLINIF